MFEDSLGVQEQGTEISMVGWLIEWIFFSFFSSPSRGQTFLKTVKWDVIVNDPYCGGKQ
jgi:hypothetical protein